MMFIDAMKDVLNKYFLVAIAVYIVVLLFIMPLFGVEIWEWNSFTTFVAGFIYGMIAYPWSIRMVEWEKEQEEQEEYTEH